MMRRLLPLIWLCLSSWALAGNRADVNADRSVNAADLAILVNLVAGNIDIAGYDLANVVVVAPQGGDFTNPVDASDWVKTQSPSANRRFVILVTPGVYRYWNQFILPSYTTLCGYGPGNTRLVQGSSGYEGVYAYDNVEVTIANLRIDAPRWGVTAQASSRVRLEHCLINVSGEVHYTVYGITCWSSDVEVVDCEVTATHNLADHPAYALYLPYTSGDTDPYIRLRSSVFLSTTPTAGLAYYHFRADATHGRALFFQCIMSGQTNATTQLVRFGCSDPNGIPVP